MRLTVYRKDYHKNVTEPDNYEGLGGIDCEDLEPSIAYLTHEGFITWFFDSDGELCLKLSEEACKMEFR